MILLTDTGELVVVELFAEPTLYKNENVIKAIKSIDKLEGKYYVKDEVRLLTFDSDRKLNWQVIQCPYSDDSSLGHWYSQFDTKGLAIRKMQRDGYDVYMNGKLIENPEKLKVLKLKP